MVRGIREKNVQVDPDFYIAMRSPRSSLPNGTRALVLRSQDGIQQLTFLKDLRFAIFKALNPEHYREGQSTISPELDITAGVRKECELLALAYLMDPGKLRGAGGGRVVELAAGTSDVGLVLKHRQPELSVTTMELKPYSAKVAQGNARALGVERVADIGDLNTVAIPGGIWVAKHPCGELADQIIEKWTQRKDSPMLFLMTCCHGGAKKKPRYGIDRDTWKQLCSRSDWTADNDPRKREIGQATMDRLDQFRIAYIKRAGYTANLYHASQILEALGIPAVPVYKGNIVVAEKPA